MDFYEIREREGGTARKPVLEIYPEIQVGRSRDLMVRAKAFYAIWDEAKGMWSDDEYDVQRLVDEDLRAYQTTTTGYLEVHRKLMGNFSSSVWLQFRNYMAHVQDNYKQLDESLTFKNSEVRKEDYVSKRLSYDLCKGDISAWDEIVGTLYDKENRAKIEWAIGAIVTGDSKTIQKFLVFYGSQGTGKSTILNIIQWLFESYVETFVAKDVTGANNGFALEIFKTNPLVVIEHDGDLSKIQDNSKLNSMVSHEYMQINEKYKPPYSARINAMAMIGTNTPVKITDSKSGLIRRLLDIHPTGNLLAARKYQALMNQVKFELGAIAAHCRDVYLSMGKDYYAGYKPIEMMLSTDVFFNYIEANYDIFKAQNGVTLVQAFEMYKQFIKDTEVEFSLPRHKFREELRNYFDDFEDRAVVDGERVRSWYSGFNADRFKSPTGKVEEQHMFTLVMEETTSLFDKKFANCLAQESVEMSNGNSKPRYYWDDSERLDKNGEKFTPKPDQIVQTKLKDLDTTKEHYVKVPKNHIVIDFDLKDADGKKSAERNLEAASQWPSTYAEFSKSGDGIHLHYNYVGDPSELSNFYDDGIEVKVYTGNGALRRRLSRCNNVPIADISSGLPLKEKKVINEQRVANEKNLRELIKRNMRKEIHPGTKPSMDFIHHILEEAYASGLTYNVTDMRNGLLAFAMNSTNQSLACIKLLQTMKLASEDAIEAIVVGEVPETFKTKSTLNADNEVIFDVEVFPNLFVVCWGYKDSPDSSNVAMVNPSPQEIETLLGMKLVGFNNRQYDNHILYGAMLGLDNLGLYKLSKSIIENHPGSKYGEAYNVSYTDIFDFASKKQSLKKWEVELGIHHMELGFDWDKPVAKEDIPKVVEYCMNDVNATKVVRKHLEPDFIARQILADLSGLSMNSTTLQHTTKIVFGDDRKPQDKFVYTDLSEMFPGYSYGYNAEKKKQESTYKGEITGEGGYVYAEPGMYENVVTLDIASMHPTSIEALNLFGDYTGNFSALKAARIAIKRKNYDEAKKMLGGKLARHLNDPSQAEALSYALKIVINIVYGLTSARFDNAFKDPRNIDNIVAKRGALFMIELKNAVQERGFQVVHIKTDSIKIPNATQEIIDFVFEFGAKYGYDFENEGVYQKFCLVNDAVFVAQKEDGKWTATGAQFQHPYVFKYLFSKEPITFLDMCETRSVQVGAMYLDFTGIDDTPMALMEDLNENNMRFVGKTGRFTPLKPGNGGGYLLRVNDDKNYAVTGTKGFFWMESERVQALKLENEVDTDFYKNLVNDAIEAMQKFGDYEWFIG